MKGQAQTAAGRKKEHKVDKMTHEKDTVAASKESNTLLKRLAALTKGAKTGFGHADRLGSSEQAHIGISRLSKEAECLEDPKCTTMPSEGAGSSDQLIDLINLINSEGMLQTMALSKMSPHAKIVNLNDDEVLSAEQSVVLVAFPSAASSPTKTPTSVLPAKGFVSRLRRPSNLGFKSPPPASASAKDVSGPHSLKRTSAASPVQTGTFSPPLSKLVQKGTLSPPVSQHPSQSGVNARAPAFTSPRPQHGQESKSAVKVAPSPPQNSRSPAKLQPAALSPQRGGALSPPPQNTGRKETPVSSLTRARVTASTAAQHNKPPMSPPRYSTPSSPPLQRAAQQQQRGTSFSGAIGARASPTSRTSPASGRQRARDQSLQRSAISGSATPKRSATPIRNATTAEAKAQATISSLEKALAAEKETSEAVVKKLRAEVADAHDQTKKALSALDAAKGAMEAREVQLLEELKQQEEAAASKEQEPSEEMNAREEEVTRLKDELVQAREQKEAFEDKINTLKITVAQHEDKIAKLETTVKQHEQKIDELGKENAAVQAANETYKQQVAGLAEKVKMLKADVKSSLEATQAAHDKTTQLQKKMTEMQKNKGGKVDATLKKKLENRTEELFKERMDNEKLERQVNELKVGMQLLRATGTRLESDKDELVLVLRALENEEPGDREANLQEKIRDLRSQMNIITNENTISRARMADLEAQIDLLNSQGVSGPSEAEDQSACARRFK